MYPDFVELCMGHHLPGIRHHYFKPDTETLLEGTKDCKGYVSIINDLTINEEHRLSKKIQELQTKNQDKDYIIKGKLQEKDEEIKGMKEQINEMNKKFEQVFSLIQQNPELAQVKPEVLISKHKA
jgi:seryl-tRNA synthetase